MNAAVREIWEELGLVACKVTRLRDCDCDGSVNQHRVCLIEATGHPHLRGKELVAYRWWDTHSHIHAYAHVYQIVKKLKKGTKGLGERGDL